jgi:3-(3-hydroxy-phenyl)propionate hydroxylase
VPSPTTQCVEVDVLVVGHGPVGAALAVLLGAYGVRTMVIDRAADIVESPRAIALDNEALRILQMAGLTDDAFPRVVIPKVSLRSPRLGEFGRFDTAGTVDGHPKLVTFYQPDLERALRQRALSHPSVTARSGVELVRLVQQRQGVTAVVRTGEGGGTVGEQTVRARYVVGADGAGSTVRAAIGEELVGATYAEDWLIVDARDVPGGFDHVEFLCDPERPTPHMIAPGGRTRWELMLRPGETREEMETDETVQRLLRAWVKPEELRIERRAVYRFEARASRRFQNRKGNVFLAGDAAHVTPPFAGQGLVSGLRDAANLAWKLAWVVRGQASPQILDTYDQERRPHAVKMIALARLMGALVMPRDHATAFVVHGALALLRRVPLVRRYIDELGVKPKNAFARGLFVPGGARGVRGSSFPQVSGRSDDLLGTSLALVGLGDDPRPRLSPESRRRWSRAGGITVLLPTGGGDRRCFVVRPDRTILHDGPVEHADRIVRESLQLLAVR